MRLVEALPAALAIAAGSAILSWSVAPPAIAAPKPRTHVIAIDKMKFGPVPSGIRAGDTILWVNRDIFRHTATSREGGFDVDLPPKGKAKIIVRKAGAFPFVCRYHPGMKGRLNVAR